MANEKLTDRTIATAADVADLIHVVDVSDTTDSPEGTSKQITKANFVADLGGALSIQDENATEQFTTDTEILQFEGVIFDAANKRIINPISVLDANIFYIENGATLSEAEPYNRNKPYPTIDDAVTAYKALTIPAESSTIHKPFVIFDVVDGSQQTISQQINRPVVGNVNFAQKPKIVINSKGTLLIENTDTLNTLKLTDFKGATLEINCGKIRTTGAGDIDLTGGQDDVILKIKAFTVWFGADNHSFGDLSQSDASYSSSETYSTIAIETASKVEINNCYFRGGAYHFGTVSEDSILILNNINYVTTGSTSGSIGEVAGKLYFDTINSDFSFNLCTLGFGGYVSHGNVLGTVSTHFNYMTVAFTNFPTAENVPPVVEYKPNCLVKLPCGFKRTPNSYSILYLKGGEVTYSNTNQSYLLQSVINGFIDPVSVVIDIRSLNVDNNLINIDRGGSAVKLISCQLTLGNVVNSGIGSVNDVADAPATNTLLIADGDCLINSSVADTTDVIYNAVASTNGDFDVVVNGSLKIRSGVINVNGNIVKPSGTLTTY